MKQVIIKRSKWTAGSFYRPTTETYCAIGFAMRAAGFKENQVTRALSAYDATGAMVATAEKLIAAGLHKLVCPVKNHAGVVIGFRFNDLAERIMRINDALVPDEHGNNRTLTPERERKLTEAFKKAKLELIFE